MKQINKFYSRGKLMLTGEYLVLQGATSLALATHSGQRLMVEATDNPYIQWISIDQNKEVWFGAEFSLASFEIMQTTDKDRAAFLQSIFVQIKRQQPTFFTSSQGFFIESRLDFDPDWGLGSSSTLINNLASWAKISPFELLKNTLGGSGYDIAVAKLGSHVLYECKPLVKYKKVAFDPPFKENLFFVYLNKKQDSATEVKNFNAKEKEYHDAVKTITAISNKLWQCKKLLEFESLVTEHNHCMASVLERPSSQDEFSDYEAGTTKYLGAWGGDFMLATGSRGDMKYFKDKGFKTILSFEELIVGD